MGGAVGVVVLNDTATLSGGVYATGTIKFKLFAPSDPTCSGTPAYQETVPVSGNGAYSTHNTTPANAVGTWHWTAKYSGDANNTSASEQVPSGAGGGDGLHRAGFLPGLRIDLDARLRVERHLLYPQGELERRRPTGIDVVNVEGSSITNTLIPTADIINSCASNSVTGKTVCTANNTQVYVISGTAVTTS